jgi:hypothetical protein
MSNRRREHGACKGIPTKNISKSHKVMRGTRQQRRKEQQEYRSRVARPLRRLIASAGARSHRMADKAGWN